MGIYGNLRQYMGIKRELTQLNVSLQRVVRLDGSVS